MKIAKMLASYISNTNWENNHNDTERESAGGVIEVT